MRDDPGEPAHQRPRHLRVQGQPRVVEQRLEDLAGARFGHREHLRCHGPADSAAGHAGDVGEQPTVGLPPELRLRAVGGDPEIAHQVREHQRQRRPAHRSDRPVDPLRHVDRQVDVQAAEGFGGHREQRGDRPRLGQPERAITVDGPLDVLRGPVVARHVRAQRGERAGLVVGYRRMISLLHNRFRAAAGLRANAGGLVAEPPRGDPAGLHHEVVRGDRAGYHRLAESGVRVDHGLGSAPGYGVRGEQHAGRGRVHHALHDHRQPYRAVVDAVGRPVGHRSFCPQ